MQAQIGDKFVYHGSGLRGRVFDVTHLLEDGSVIGEVVDNPNASTSIVGSFVPNVTNFEWIRLGGKPVLAESTSEALAVEVTDEGWTPAAEILDDDDGWTPV